MTTLKSILDTETRLEVIFGHIHRRHAQIKSILGRQRERERAYEQLKSNDTLDLAVIRGFFVTLTSTWEFENSERMDLHVGVEVRLEALRSSLGIEEHIYRSHTHFGMGLAFLVMYPNDQGYEAYRNIYPLPKPVAA